MKLLKTLQLGLEMIKIKCNNILNEMNKVNASTSAIIQ